MRMQWSRLVIAFVLAVSANAQQPSNSPSLTPTHAQSKPSVVKRLPMPMTAPLFLESGAYTSTLYLVNQLNFGVQADVSLYDTNGSLLTTGHRYLNANSDQTISILKLLGDAGMFAEVGSVEIVSPENSDALLGQLSITRAGKNKAYLDEELFMSSSAGTRNLRAVIDSPQNSPIVSVANVSATTAETLHIDCIPSIGSTISKTVSLQPKQTKLVRACSTIGDIALSPGTVDSQFNLNPESSVNMSGEQTAGISITSDGPSGEIAAFGFVEHADTYGHYFSAMNFADLGLLKSSGTVFAGVPAGPSLATSVQAYAPQVALTNFSQSPQTTSIYLATTQSGVSDSNAIAQITLPANSSKFIELPNAKGSSQWNNSYIVRSSGQPGDVLSKMMFKTKGPLPNIELIGKDEQDMHNAGDHPWSVENGIRSTLYLFNHGETTRKVTIRIGSGSNVLLKIYDLHPNETKSLVIGDIVQSETRDDKGYAFPRSITHGEVSWWAPNAGAPKVKGRVVQIDNQGTMARNFSCGTVIELSSITWPNYDGDFQVATGQVIDITPQPVFSAVPYPPESECPSGDQTTTQNTYLSWEWNVTNSGITNFVNGTQTDQTADFEGISQGTTAIYASAGVNSLNVCTADGSMYETGPPPKITSVSPIVYGGTGTVTIQGNGFSGAPTVTSQSGNITFTNAATNNTATTITATYKVACGSTSDSIIVSSTGETQAIPAFAIQLTLPNASMPTITLNGNSVSGTEKVAVGEKIALAATIPSLPPCMQLQSQSWTPPAASNAVGNFNASVSSGQVVPISTISTSGSSYAFYWTTPGNPLSTNFSYSITPHGGGSQEVSPIASIVFNVEGPTKVTVSSTLGTINISQTNYLRLGGSEQNLGIDFIATSTAPTDFQGSYCWVQILNSYKNVNYPPSGSPTTCVASAGLDTNYPYDEGNDIDDEPKVELVSPYVQETITNTFTMYLMWIPTVSTDAIPVPLGSVSWNWSGNAIYSSSTKMWSLNTSGNTAAANPFVPSTTTFPQWDQQIDAQTDKGFTCSQ